jgi:hypothetical protein
MMIITMIMMIYTDPELESSILMSDISNVLTYHTLELAVRKKDTSSEVKYLHFAENI